MYFCTTKLSIIVVPEAFKHRRFPFYKDECNIVNLNDMFNLNELQ